MIGIIRGIWGDETLRRRGFKPPGPYNELLQNVRTAVEENQTIDRVYCYGTANQRYLDSLGLDSTLLSPNAWDAPQRDKEVSWRFRWNGAIRHGYSYWWHKLKILEAALHDFSDGVIWMDFDIQQFIETSQVDSFKEQYATGQPFRSSLYLQQNWTWGSGWRHKWDNVPGIILPEAQTPETHVHAQTVCGCGFLYVRDLEIVEHWLSIQEEFPHFLDHQVVSLWFDREYGSGHWIGDGIYNANGFGTFGYYYPRQKYPDLNSILFSPRRAS